MIYEMRVYRCVPGRLPALLNRFNTITLKIWERHGIKQAGFFTTLIGESNQELTYFLAWESLADREKKWNAFAADPEWHGQARRDREGRRHRRERLGADADADGLLVGPASSRDYSALRPASFARRAHLAKSSAT